MPKANLMFGDLFIKYPFKVFVGSSMDGSNDKVKKMYFLTFSRIKDEKLSFPSKILKNPKSKMLPFWSE